jgi:hypothetical protein
MIEEISGIRVDKNKACNTEPIVGIASKSKCKFFSA